LLVGAVMLQNPNLLLAKKVIEVYIS